MRLRYLLLAAVFSLTFSNGVFSQVNKYQYTMYGDSLTGFDEEYHKAAALAEGLYGQNFLDYMTIQKRAYINVRYDLVEKVEFPGTMPNYFSKLGGGTVLNAPCNNEDFENGTMGGWTAQKGVNSSSQVYPTFNVNLTPPSSSIMVVPTPTTDPILNVTIPNSPLGGSMVARINNTVIGTFQVIRIQQTFPVTLTNYLFDFAYWAVMQNASGHNCTQTPYMAVRVRNFTGTLQACPNFSIVAPSSGSGGCAGIGPTSWVSANGGNIQTSNGWQKFSIDLSGYIGNNVTIEAYVAHCSQGAHYGYAYFDAHCGTMNLTVNSQTYSMPYTNVTPTVICGGTATMVAPGGLGPYQWFGPSGSGINGSTSQTVVTTVPGNYTLNMSPAGICNPPMQKLVSLSFVPPTTITVSQPTICNSGTNTITTLTALGGSNYTWMPGSLTGSQVSVSPSSTTIYTLTAQSGTCIGTFTALVTVGANPNINVAATSPSVCGGGSTTLTASGGVSYLWMPGSMTGSQVAVNPSNNTTYTVTGTNAGGCQSTASIQIGVSTTPTVGVFPSVSPTVCAGTPVVLVGLGATSFSWYPTSPLNTNQVAAITPTITTQYTVIGSNGTCTDSAVHTVTVDPGPSMTITASPTITCPGINTTLTAIAPTSLGYTWQPGNSNSNPYVVNPAVTTIYSVTGVNANNCRATYTINKRVAPLPVVTFNPASPTVCIGSAITLTASGGNTYTWTPGGSTANTLQVAPTVNTTYSVTASNGTCASTNSVQVTAIPVPTVNASASPSVICRGQTSLLSATGANNYTWSPGGATGANVIVSPTVTTTYTVRGNTTGCSSTRTLLLVVNPLPTVNVAATPTAVCPSFCSTLTPSGASTYTYVNGGPVVCPGSTTTYSIFGTSAAGCVSAFAGTRQIVVNPTPVINLTPASASVCAGNSVTINATGASTYTWMPGSLNGTSQNLSPAATTVYTVTGTSAAGCLGQKTINIIVVPIPTVNATASPTIICAGRSSTITPSGATNYTLLPGGSTSAPFVVSPTSNTTYTVRGNTGGCTSSKTLAITVNPAPNVLVTANPMTICAGGCTTLMPSGANSYTFLPAGPIVCPTITTTYTVGGTNAFGCTDLTPASITIIVSPIPSFTVSASPSTVCAGGSVTLSGTGASSYTWLPGGFTGNGIIVIPNGTTTYTAIGASASGCTSTRTITVTVVPIPTVNASASPATVCPGGASNLSATGATSYTWQPPNVTGANITVNPFATTLYTVTGSNGACSSTKTVLVNVSTPPVINVSSSPAQICSGSCATLSASGGLSYTWTPGNTNGPTTVVCPTINTTYSVTGANSSGCRTTASITLIVNPRPTIVPTATSFSICAGGSTTLSATGGTSYIWSPGNNPGQSVAVSPTITTVYTVTGTNSNGCTGQATIAIIVVPTPVVNASANPATICAGRTSTLTATGASGYVWNPGPLLNSPVVVAPSSTTIYTVTGTTSGCSGTRTVMVTVNPNPVIAAVASNTMICRGNCASLTATGGNNYTWTPGNLTTQSPVVCPTVTTVYTVTGANGSGCTGTAVVTINVLSPPSVVVSPSTSSLCAGQSRMLVAGGASAYTWLPGNMTGDTVIVTPASTTVYTVTGTNSFGCSSTATAVVIVQPLPVVSISKNPGAICAGNCSTLTASGAQSYSWSNGSFGATTVVCPTLTTTYSVMGTSSAGCASTVVATIVTVNPLPALSATASPNVLCSGNSSTLSANGANTYTWLPGNQPVQTIVVAPGSSTTYTVNGTSGAGCVGSTTVSVSVNQLPVVSVFASTTSVCPGFPVFLSGAGAASYSWMPGSLSGQIVSVNPTITTTYTMTGTSSAGCSRTATITINVVPPPNVVASTTSTRICIGQCATLTASGANSYTWLPQLTTGPTAVVCPTVNSSYTVVGQGAQCFSFAVISISVTPLPNIFAIATPTSICAGQSAVLSGGGGVSFTWTPGPLTGANVTVTPNNSTTYTVTGSDGFCTNTQTTFVQVNPAPSLSITASSSSVCAGKSVTLTATGATGYTWSPGGSQFQFIVVNPTITTTYTVTGISQFGCTGTASVTIFVVPNPVVNASANQSTICAGSCAILAGTGAGSYVWYPGALTGANVTVCPNSTTNYTVVGSAGSCTSTAAVLVNVQNGPVVSASANPAVICAGNSSTLSASGASSYSWSPGGSTTQTVAVTPSGSTIYTVRGFSSGGCSSTATVAVAVTPNPVISTAGSTGSICAGGVAQLLASGATSFTWQPGPHAGSNVTVAPVSTTVYTVTGSQNNCTSTAQHTVNVVPLPVLNPVALPASICNNSSSTLTASGAQSYSWYPGPVLGNAVVVSPSSSTIYTVVGITSAGCTGTQTVSVSVGTQPVIIVSSTSNTICAGSSATLTASGTLSYTWFPSMTTGSVLVVNPNSTTSYSVFGSNGPACSNSALFTQFVSPVPSINVNASSTSVCEGFTTALSATGANSYTWHPGAIQGSTAIFTITAPTVFTVDGDSGGCVASNTIFINSVPLPTITIVATPTAVCPGMPVVLTASGANTFTWLPMFTTGAVVSDTPSATTQYTVAGFSSNGCPNFDTLTVPVLNVPNIVITSSSPSVCLGATGTLTATGATSYTWMPGNGSGSQFTISPTAPTDYTVYGDNGACSGSAVINIGIHQLPSISAAVSPSTVCGGSPVNLTGSGGLSYTWSPIGLTGASVVDNPTISITYTVTGDDANGCTNTAMVSVSVNPAPVLLAVANPSGMCEGSLVTATLTVSGGAQTYTWLPSGSNSTIITESPTVTTVYTVQGTDNIGCVGTATVSVGVFPIPTLAVVPLNSSVCIGSSATLTATGATNYTWLPSGGNFSVEIVTPTGQTTYTVIGDNGGICLDTTTVDVFVNPLPANVTASVTGTITCASPSVNLFGASTDTNVSYSWSGPGGYSSGQQNPTGVSTWGTFTLSVTDNVTGCTATATVDVPTDGSIPLVNAITSGSITCATGTVLLNAVNTTTNPGYQWTGPAAFTSTDQVVPVSTAGDYTVVVTDLTSLCTGSAVVTVGTHTEVTVTASITVPTCSAGVSLNDGTIMVGNFGPLDRFDLVEGTTYTGTMTYTDAITIPGDGIITSNLGNPIVSTPYTLRVFDSLGCVKDFVLTLEPVDCTLRPLGLAKVASTPTLNADGTYDVLYSIVLTNYDTAALSSVVVTENLANAFPAPATFSIPGAIQVTGANVTLNAGFDGALNTSLTSTTSILSGGETATITLPVRITPSGFFGPFSNTVSAVAMNSLNIAVNDLSTDGPDPDPDQDGNPGNNSAPTVISLNPNLFFGLTKVGTFNQLDNNSFDVSYTITVHNLGNDTLKNVVIQDSLYDNTVKAPAGYTIKSGPVVTGGLVAGTGFDGRFNTNLVDASQSRIAPGETSTVTFTINVVPDTVTVLRNSAIGSAAGNFSGTVVRDTSNAGSDPDVNDNGVWNEAEDNVPTVLVLPTSVSTRSLFVPEGFSPDDDGINEFFIIKGLPEGQNTITVFNRWGNKVYHHDDYDNSWNGYPNVTGTFGRDKLPAGTYYYVLEMKGATSKSITGYVILQR